MVETSSRVESPVESWNSMVESLRATKQAWGDFQEVMLKSSSRRTIEELGYNAQIWLTTPMVRMSFERALPLLVSKWSTSGGMEMMVLEDIVQKTSEGKEEKKHARRK